MPLSAGDKLGLYEIISPLGAGGMGEVYRARDTKLGREVAIKILPEEFTQHPQKLARFEREARLLAALNHPGIATLFGVEDEEGKPFLVMELVEGETLADRIGRGPIPVDEALEISRQIAEALEAAHEKGVIHRDLKPANVKVDPEGKVKVLDFGLAKAFADEVPESELSQSPTLSRDATRAGVILGTAAYMSPEQAKGKAVDKRTDIFSFGIFLFEMLTGKKAFAGEDASDVLAAIIRSEPDWTSVSSDLDPRIQSLLRRCLKKDRKKRLRDIGDVRNELEVALSEPTVVSPALATSTTSRAREKVAWGLAMLATLLGGIGTWSLLNVEPPAQHIIRFPLTLPSEVALTGLGRHVVAFSPDGTGFVYGANNQLYLRQMDGLEAVPIRGTDVYARSPFFSPNGEWVGFWAGNRLMKVPVTGGVPTTICQASNPFGVSWGVDDTIVFGRGAEGIFRVSANGGTPELLIPMDNDKAEIGHGPQMLPDGETVLFTLRTGSSWDESQIVAQSLKTGERRVLVEGGSDARYVPTGHLVYAVGETLLAVPFEPSRREVIGASVPVVEGVARAPGQTGAAHAAISDTGSLVFVQSDVLLTRSLVWVYRDGREETLAAAPGNFFYPRISPDGREVAFDTADQDRDIWVLDLTRETLRRLTFDPNTESYSVWEPGGRYLVFSSARDGPANLFRKAADGTGNVERLTESRNPQFPNSFSPDGRQLVLRERHPERGSDIVLLSMEGEGSLTPLLATESDELNAEISPDGRWFAYQSDASGQYEIYVRPFPNDDGTQWQLTTGGGTEPLWAPDGRELFYLDLNERLMSLSVELEPDFGFGRPTVIVDGAYFAPVAVGRTYDVSPDGERFLMMTQNQGGTQTIHVILNWFEELKQPAPMN